MSAPVGPNGPAQAPPVWRTPVIVEIEGEERDAILREEWAEQAAANKEAVIAAVEDGDVCCALLEVFLDARLVAAEGGDDCCIYAELEAAPEGNGDEHYLYDHAAFKARLAGEPASGGYPPGFAAWPLERRNKWFGANTAAILADSEHLVGCRPEESAEPFIMPNLETPFARKFKGGGAFIREYEPISYTLDGILPSGVLYFVTARRGTGKTAWLLAVIFAVALKRPEIIGVEVEQGHVAFICLENPTDVRMKMAVYAWRFNVPLDDLDAHITVIDGRLSVTDIIEQLKVAAEEKGPLQLVGYDTFQAGFGTSGASKGADFNDNAPTLNFTQELRKLLELPGHPSVLVNAHPCKNATEGELIPYGGGAIPNEYDGNLTLWVEGGTIKLHWLDKLRGPEFKPLFYKIEKIASPDILDTKGRQIELPVCVPLDEQAVEQRQSAKAATNIEILKAIREMPKGTLRQWATAAAGMKNESSLRARLVAMEKLKLVKKRKLDGKYEISREGMKELLQIVPKEADQ